MVNFYKHDIPAWMDGTESLGCEAYRVYHVVCQLIYLNEGPIALNERGISGRCCLSTRAFRTALKELLDGGKVILTEGRLSNSRANFELQNIRTNRENARKGGQISGVVRENSATGDETSQNVTIDDRKPLKTNDPGEASLLDDRSLKEKTREEKTREERESEPPPTEAADEWSFDVFWKLFPNKVGKEAVPNKKGVVSGGARQAFDRVRKSGAVTWPDFMAGLTRYVNKTDDRSWCNPTTFLNQSRWADEPATVVRPINGVVPHKPKAKARVAFEFPVCDKEKLEKLLHTYLVWSKWDREIYGPSPHERGCLVPRKLIEAAGIQLAPLLVNGQAWATTAKTPDLELSIDPSTPHQEAI